MGTPNYNFSYFESADTFYDFIRGTMGATGSSNMELIDAVVSQLNNKLRICRQGGSATNWNTPGATTRTLNSMYVQYGNAATIDFPNGLISVTFPVAYSDVPLVFVMPETTVALAPNQSGSTVINTVSATGFTGRYKSIVTAPATITEETATFDITITKVVLSHSFWIALGPRP